MIERSPVIDRMAEVVERVSGLVRVYAASRAGLGAIPEGDLQTPCAIVFAGPVLEHRVLNRWESIIWELNVDLFAAGDYGERARSVLDLADAVRSASLESLVLDGLQTVSSITFRADSGLTGLPWSEVLYAGHRLTWEVKQDANAPTVAA